MSLLSPILGNSGSGDLNFNGNSLSNSVSVWSADYFQRLEDITTFSAEGSVVWGQCESYLRGTVGGLLMYGSGPGPIYTSGYTGSLLAASGAIYSGGSGYGPNPNPTIYPGMMPPPQNVKLVLQAQTNCTISFLACFEHGRTERRVNEVSRYTADFVSQGPIVIAWVLS